MIIRATHSRVRETSSCGGGQFVASLARWATCALFLALSVGTASRPWGTYVVTGATANARSEATVTLLQSGKVLIAGGGSAELYDPTLGTWTATGKPIAVRQGHSATLLQNGKVLVAGGSNSSGVLNTTELYDPATSKWTAAATITSLRVYHEATLLADGRVLLAGGASATTSSATLNSAEIYDPATNRTAATGSFTVGKRYQASSILLDNGKVLMTGGQSETGATVAT